MARPSPVAAVSAAPAAAVGAGAGLAAAMLRRVYRRRSLGSSKLFSSAVSFTAVSDGDDVDGVLVLLIEEHSIVATAEPEARERRLELLHIASAVSQIAIQATKNLHRGVAIDGAEIGPGLWGQITAIRSGAGGSVIYSCRTRAECLRGERPRHGPAKRGHAP